MNDKAYLALRELLTSGNLRAGQFVSMSDLVQIIGLPLAPVREAVKRVESAGLVRVLPKRGVEVMSANSTIIWDCLHLRTIFDQEGARQLVRSQSLDRVDELRNTHEVILNAAKAGVTSSLQQEAMAVDWALHITLMEGLENESAKEIYARNRDRILVIQHSRPLLPDRIVPAMTEHLAIISAILSGNEEAAATEVSHHFKQTLRWWGIMEKFGKGA